MNPGRVAVAVPVKDEADRLAACLRALAGQAIAVPPDIVVLVNNSTDASAEIARGFAAVSACRVRVENVVLPQDAANAGTARRIAMDMAAELAEQRGIVLTTDADGVVAPDWVHRNLTAIAAGADAVAGRAVIDPIDAAGIPQALRDADARECRYAALLDEIAAIIDPDPSDPWPRHDEHSGASIAVTVAAFRRAGGIPNLAMGEDRAFFGYLRRVDARIRHAPEVRVTVSGRIDGRACGGMADTIRRRLSCPDMFLDDRLEPAHAALLRARLRRRTRLQWAAGAASAGGLRSLARELSLPARIVSKALSAQWFGASWETLECASPGLRRHKVPIAAVGVEISNARAILRELRTPRATADQGMEASARSTSSR